MLINANNEGVPLVLSRNQWHATLKGHALHYLDIYHEVHRCTTYRKDGEGERKFRLIV